MALPAHLAKYDGLLDLLVETLVREVSSELSHDPQTATPIGTASLSPTGVNFRDPGLMS